MLVLSLNQNKMQSLFRKSLATVDLVLRLTIPIVGLMVWLYFLPNVSARDLGDLGIVDAIHPIMLLSPLIIIVSFCWNLRRLQEPVLLLHLLILIFILYHSAEIISEAPRFSTTYVHIGFTEVIQRTGQSLTLLDARFSWPGFFAGAGLFTGAAGFDLAASYAEYASLFFNLAALGILYWLFRGLTDNLRLVWFALLIWYLNNWVGQDYFAPQALNFLFYITIISVVINWFKDQTSEDRSRSRRFWFGYRINRLFIRIARRNRFAYRVSYHIREFVFAVDTPNKPSNRWQRIGLVLVMIAMMSAMVGSHQLTPFFTLFALSGMILMRRTSLYGFAFVAGMLTLAWVAFMTTDYLSGHLQGIISDVGSIFSTYSENVVNRVDVSVSADRQFVLYLRVFSTVGLWGLALIGALRQGIAGRWHINAIILLTMPFVVLGLQSYGGEGLLRIQYFTLPAAAFLIGSLFYAEQDSKVSFLMTFSSIGAAIIFLVAFMFTRFGNEKMDFMAQDEFEGVHYLYDTAPESSLILAYSGNSMLSVKNVEKYKTVFFRPEWEQLTLTDIVATMQQRTDTESYIIISNSAQAYGELFEGKEDGWLNQFAQELEQSPYFSLIYENPAVHIFTLANDVPIVDPDSAIILGSSS